MAVIEVTPAGLVLREIAADTTVERVKAATGADLDRPGSRWGPLPQRHRRVILVSACRTPIGSFGGALKDLSAVDLGAIVDSRGDRARRRGAGGRRRRDHGLRAAGRRRHERRAAGGAQGRRCPVEVPAETVNRVCGSGLQAVVHAVEAMRVGYVDTIVAGGTESMSNAPYLLQGRAVGLPHGQRGSHRLDAERRPDLRDQLVPHGDHRRGSRAAATTCRAPIRTRSRPRASVAPRAAHQDGIIQGRNRSRRRSAEERRSDARRHRRIPAAGDDGRKARGAQAGLHEGRLGDGRQCVGHQRRRRGARRHGRRETARKRGAMPLARSPGVRRRPASIRGHGHRPGSGRPKGARPRRPGRLATSISSS